MRTRIAALILLSLAFVVVVRSPSINPGDIWQQLKDDIELIQSKMRGIDWEKHYSNLRVVYRQRNPSFQEKPDPMLSILRQRQESAIKDKDWDSVEKLQHLMDVREDEIRKSKDGSVTVR